MDKICEKKELIMLLILVFKYLVPLLILFIGIIKLLCINNKKRAIKKFIKIFLIAVIICLFMNIVQIIFTKNISCNMEEKNENINQEEINQQPELPEKEVIKIEPKPEVIGGITYIDGIMIVNKTYSIPANYEPENANGYNLCNSCLTKETLQAFNDMQADAISLGLNIYISSGYRSYNYQQQLYNNYVSYDGKALADTYSARPGHSEHQTGLAFDLNTIDDSFAYTDEGQWVSDNCWKYGLILRYPKGKDDITGYQYESWHLRYVGDNLAEKLYNDGDWITLEEYYNLTSIYEDV